MTDEINPTDEGPLPMPAMEETQLNTFIDSTDMEEADAEFLRSITRLLVGGALVGWDELLSHLQTWENDVATARARAANVVNIPPQDPAVNLRYAMIGLLFEGQGRMVKRSKQALNLAWQVTEAFWSPFLNRVNNNRQLDPARDRYDELVRRGEAVTGGWVDRGRDEEDRSRRLALTAAQETFDTSMDQLGKAPALEDLILRQSAGITQSAMDEGRSRAVSADILSENLARRILRRVPRQQLQEPDPTQEPEEESESADSG